MIKLASLALRSPLSAASVSTGLLFLGLILPLLLGPAGSVGAIMLIWSSAAILALVMLRRGEASAALSVLSAVVLVACLSFFAKGAVFQILLVTVQFWLPALTVAWVLRRTVSLDLAMLSAAVVGVLAIVFMYARFGNPEQLWIKLFSEQFEASGLLDVPGWSPELLSQMTARMAKMATPASAILIMLTAATSVLLARAWQAGLFNPGGFQKEFHRLWFGKLAAWVVLTVTALAMMVYAPMLSNISVVLMTAFLFQGLAVIHCLVKQRGMAGGWLVGIYVLLILPHTIALLGALGLADNWLDLRKLGNHEKGSDGGDSKVEKRDSALGDSPRSDKDQPE